MRHWPPPIFYGKKVFWAGTKPQNSILEAASLSGEFDFVSRFFAPAAGVNEDPVTGSSHCCLEPFWQARLRKDNFTAFQASRRGGVLKVRVRGDRVLISGKAITVFAGNLFA
nr:PhzF family phenazine biosynthesis protein [Pelotomaculum propionicicum]